MSKDYKSFSSIAKSRFRHMAQELGYEQISGINYLKQRDGWFEGFSLQSSSYGNDFFYINYGVLVSNVWEPFEKEINKKNMGYWLSLRLHDDFDQGFPNATKVQVEKSAEIALERYREQALPWFNDIQGLNDIAEKYFDSTNLKRAKVGQHALALRLTAANYGLLLFKSGDLKNSKIWLEEADRLYSLDEDIEDYEIEQHKTIINAIKCIKSA